MKKITRWSPDTCGCKLEYSWDTNDPQDNRQHIFERVVQTCPAHQSIAMPVSVYDHVKDENQTKNRVEKEIKEKLTRVVETVRDKEGNESKEFKPGIHYNWRFVGEGESRKLQFSLEGASLNVAEKQILTNAIGLLKKSVEIL